MFWAFAQKYKWTPDVVSRLSFPVLFMYANFEKYDDPTTTGEDRGQVVMFASYDDAVAYSQKIKAEQCQQHSH